MIKFNYVYEIDSLEDIPDVIEDVMKDVFKKLNNLEQEKKTAKKKCGCCKDKKCKREKVSKEQILDVPHII